MCLVQIALAVSLSCANLLDPAVADRARGFTPRVADAARAELEPRALARAPDWSRAQVVDDIFRAIRDARVRRDPARHFLMRRLSWLYPFDGCYVRAAGATEIIRARFPQLAPPAKVFLFGRQRLRTAYAPGGTANWSYHVALLARAGDVAWVLDPAVDWTRPLTLPEWIARQTEHPEQTRVAVCGGATYSPEDTCVARANAHPDPRLEGDERRYLDLEWRSLTALGHAPLRELGSLPPWTIVP